MHGLLTIYFFHVDLLIQSMMNSPWEIPRDVSSLGSSNPSGTRIFLGIFVDFIVGIWVSKNGMGTHWIQWEIMGYGVGSIPTRWCPPSDVNVGL